MSKKGMMLMEVTIVLVIVLIAAFAIIFLFGKQIGILSKTDDCASKRGECVKTCDYLAANYAGCKADEVCCVRVGG